MYSKEEMINYINQLADGIDPKTGELLENDTILNRGDIVRLFYALKDYLSAEQSKEDETKKKTPRTPFKISNTDGIVGEKLPISYFVKKINDSRDENTKPLGYKKVVNWLIDEGYLFINNLDKKEPTEKGKQIGIEYNLKYSQYGKEYYSAEYNSNAQQLIIDNLLNGNII